MSSGSLFAPADLEIGHDLPFLLVTSRWWNPQYNKKQCTLPEQLSNKANYHYCWHLMLCTLEICLPSMQATFFWMTSWVKPWWTSWRPRWCLRSISSVLKSDAAHEPHEKHQIAASSALWTSLVCFNKLAHVLKFLLCTIHIYFFE